MKTPAAVTALAALAQPHRLQAFRLLVKAGPEGLAAGEIAERLAIAPASLTFHLKELAAAGLVFSRREGRSIRYFLRPATMRGLLEFLTQDCCQGQPELCGLKASCCEPAAAPRRRANSPSRAKGAKS